MSRISIAQITSAIAATLRAHLEVDGVRVQDGARLPAPDTRDSLTEAMPDLPAVQVYWQASRHDALTTDRLTLGGGVRPTRLTFYADVYARRRGHIAEEMVSVLAQTDAVCAALEAQRHPPFFGLSGARALAWSAERATFEVGGSAYAGARFVIEVWVY